jgi:hypothetical protein
LRIEDGETKEPFQRNQAPAAFRERIQREGQSGGFEANPKS